MNVTLTPTKPNRIQVAFNSNPDMDARIKNLSTKYAGLSLSEIIKLAIINLDELNVNYLVGKNSSGKSQILKILSELEDLISQRSLTPEEQKIIDKALKEETIDYITAKNELAQLGIKI